MVEIDVESECLDSSCESLRLDGGIVTTLEAVSAEIFVNGTVGEQVPDGEEHRVGHRYGGFVRPTSLGDAGVLGVVVAVLGTSGGPGRFDESTAVVGITVLSPDSITETPQLLSGAASL